MSIEALNNRILEAENNLADLRRQLELAQAEASTNADLKASPPPSRDDFASGHPKELPDIRTTRLPLDLEEYKRYGRQIIVPSFGLEGQLKLKNAKILIVGVGGLGCPAAMYLAGAGVGTLGLVDGDAVELSNLHRQVLHSVESLGMPKVQSATKYLQSLNPNVRYQQYPVHLAPSNALDIFEDFDLVLDCTDHPTSRYLISDACVLAGKPLISASALRTDGQLMTLNMPPGEAPCYRCVFPKPPPANSVISCGDGGIIGPAVGVMGVLMAVKVVEMITRNASLMKTNDAVPTFLWSELSPRLLIYSSFDPQPFRSASLGKRRRNCAACSGQPSITKASLQSNSLDYAAFCGLVTPVKLLSDEQRITAAEYQTFRNAVKEFTPFSQDACQQLDFDNCKPKHLLIDVRERLQYDICHLPESINIPFSEITAQAKDKAPRVGNCVSDGSSNVPEASTLDVLESTISQGTGSVYFICRFGNDSQEAVKIVNDTFPNLMDTSHGSKRFLGDIKGGLHAWSKVDPTFPDY